MNGPLAVETTGGPFPKVKGVRRIPYREAARIPDGAGGKRWNVRLFNEVTPITEQQQAALAVPLPPRRDPNERYRSMLNRITEDMLRTYRETGTILWPASAWEELKLVAWRTGDPKLLDLGGEEQLRKQIVALTRHVVETGERKQRAKDSKKVALDYHGH